MFGRLFAALGFSHKLRLSDRFVDLIKISSVILENGSLYPGILHKADSML